MTDTWHRYGDTLPPSDGRYDIKLADGSEHVAWFISRKEMFVTPDGAKGFDNVRYWKRNETTTT